MSEPTYKLDFNSITGQKEIDQARGLRLILAIIQDDITQLAAVAEEAVLDERGWEIATWEQVIGMAGTVAQDWVSRAGTDAAVTGIQLALMGSVERGASNV